MREGKIKKTYSGHFSQSNGYIYDSWLENRCITELSRLEHWNDIVFYTLDHLTELFGLLLLLQSFIERPEEMFILLLSSTLLKVWTTDIETKEIETKRKRKNVGVNETDIKVLSVKIEIMFSLLWVTKLTERNLAIFFPFNFKSMCMWIIHIILTGYE